MNAALLAVLFAYPAAAADLRCAAAELLAADQAAKASKAPAARVEERLRRLAGLLEFYASDPAFFADAAKSGLLARAVPDELAPYVGTRRQALASAYASLAAADWYALQKPRDCRAGAAVRAAMVLSPYGLFRDEQDRPTPWLTLVRGGARSLGGESGAPAEAKAEPASYARTRGAALGLTEALRGAVGPAAETLRCRRAAAYAALAFAHLRPGQEPAAAEEEAAAEEASAEDGAELAAAAEEAAGPAPAAEPAAAPKRSGSDDAFADLEAEEKRHAAPAAKPAPRKKTDWGKPSSPLCAAAGDGTTEATFVDFDGRYGGSDIHFDKPTMTGRGGYGGAPAPSSQPAMPPEFWSQQAFQFGQQLGQSIAQALSQPRGGYAGGPHPMPPAAPRATNYRPPARPAPKSFTIDPEPEKEKKKDEEKPRYSVAISASPDKVTEPMNVTITVTVTANEPGADVSGQKVKVSMKSDVGQTKEHTVTTGADGTASFAIKVVPPMESMTMAGQEEEAAAGELHPVCMFTGMMTFITLEGSLVAVGGPVGGGLGFKGAAFAGAGVTAICTISVEAIKGRAALSKVQTTPIQMSGAGDDKKKQLGKDVSTPGDPNTHKKDEDPEKPESEDDKKKEPQKSREPEPVGRDGASERYQGVTLEDAQGNRLKDIDVVDLENKKFVEKTSGEGLSKFPDQQSPADWADKHIYKYGDNIATNLDKAAKTGWNGTTSEAPLSLDKFKEIRTVEFQVRSTDPKAMQATEDAVTRLRTKYPDWKFQTKFGP